MLYPMDLNDPNSEPTVGVRDLTGFITTVFAAWNQAGVQFIVLRNYEDLPESVSNDVDILVQPQQLALAECVLIGAAGRAGYELHNRAEFSPVSLFFFQPESLRQIQVDLFSSLRWRGFTLFSTEEMFRHRVQRNGFAVPHPAHEAAINLVTRLIYGGYVKAKYKPGISASFQAHPGEAERLLATAFGRRRGRRLVQQSLGEKWADIEKEASALRRQLVVRQVARHPFRTLKAVGADVLRLARRYLRPPGLKIAFIGPDGCGKSTVASRVIERLKHTFLPDKGLQVHWKPMIFFSQTRLHRPPTTNPHGQSPRNRLLSLFYLAGHWCEYLLGSLLLLRPVRFRNGLVIMDRFYCDFLVDQRRYQLQVSEFLIRWGYVLLPKPALIFLLDAPPEVLQSRKREVPFEETVRQRAAFLKLVQGLPNSRIINAARPPEDVAKDITRHILNYLRNRTNQRCARALSPPQTQAAAAGALGKSPGESPTPKAVVPDEWADLFRSDSNPASSATRVWFELRKQGQPFLMLPKSPQLAAAALNLYPAQTQTARLARLILRSWLRLRLPLPIKQTPVPVDDCAPFSQYLARQAGSKTFPPLAILAGNPHTPGRRFVLLLFDDNHAPACVVKAGLGAVAGALIERERGFLASVAKAVEGVPKLREFYDAGDLRAFAMEFLPGRTPTPSDAPVIERIVQAWADEGRSLVVAETAPWRQLETACAGHPLMQKLGSLRTRTVRGVLWHGDLVPWNIRLDPQTGRCAVLDWERGELAGLPAWDWFHYVIQTGILVEKAPPAALRARIGNLLALDAFNRYARRCDIQGCERELLLAYLLYCVEVLKPSEGREQTKTLLEQLAGS